MGGRRAISGVGRGVVVANGRRIPLEAVESPPFIVRGMPVTMAARRANREARGCGTEAAHRGRAVS